MLTIVTSTPKDADDEQAAKLAFEKLNELAGPTTLIWSLNHTISDVSVGDELRVLHGPGTIEEQIGGYKYRISPNAFFQTNPTGAVFLQDTVRQFAGELKDKTLLDLYCGTGFFAISMANEAKQTIGVELVPQAIADARINAELNGLNDSPLLASPSHGGRISFHDAKTEEYDWMKLGADVVILDPPRAGMHDKALKDVIAALPSRIVYVSCNFKNFAREMVELGKYYDVEQIRAIDMFPHTPHVELVTALVKKI